MPGCWTTARVRQVCEYFLDDRRIFDAGNHFDRPAADSALLNVDMENTLEPLRPGHRDMTLYGDCSLGSLVV